ncbi:MAG: hypothetical protein KF687_01970 [Cyclobacteriaceae bacterium]|nr:hypothetical protein [Cyclobacteriaceae bacterium]
MSITEQPPVKASPYVDTDVLFSVKPELLNDSYVYVHAHLGHTDREMLIRIWRSTVLIDKHSGNKSTLVHAENITFAPVWTTIPKNFSYTFLLIFHALPKACTVFDLVEQIPQPGGFFIPDIMRNKSDVYHLNIAL